MSIIYGEAIEEVVEVKRKIEGCKCDKCKRFIPALRYRLQENKYYRVLTGHHDWGNDSCDSIKSYDICPECIGEFMSEYFKTSHYMSAYLDVETDHVLQVFEFVEME